MPDSNRDARDRERSAQIDELSTKLGHAHATTEQYRSQAQAASKRLTQTEEAKFATETELANLKLEVLAQSDNRSVGPTFIFCDEEPCLLRIHPAS